jgi:hypothetical protein
MFQTRYYASAVGNARSFDISRDGQQFLMIKQGDGNAEGPQNRLIFIENWTEELKRLVPTN